MRLIAVLVLVTVFAGCTKNARIIRRIEGTWELTEMLLNDGQRTYPNELYVFEQGEKGGDSYATWTRYSANYADTTYGSYLVNKKGDRLILRHDNTVPLVADTCTIDDMDSKMLIVRSVDGVMYLYKK